MSKEYKIIREYFAVDDMDQSETISVLPLTLVDMLLEYERKVKKLHKSSVINCVPYQKCPVCEGSGQIYINQLNPDITSISIGYKPCHVCEGKGIIPMAHCL